ncbi:MAG: glycosyltransferase family 4 protein [Cyanobacteria bacterium P01_F01_bin.150]
MLNLLQVGKGWFPQESGGLNRYFYDCVQYLPSQQLNLESLVTYSAHQDQNSQLPIHFFGSAHASLPTRWQHVRQAFQTIEKSHPYDLVSSHFALYTAPLLDLLKQPLVMHFHGPWALEGEAEGNGCMKSYVKESLEKLVYGRAKHFIVLSYAFKRILECKYNVPEAKISVVPGGVNFNRFNISLSQQEARQILGLPQDRTILLAVRRLAKRMGLEQLVEAIAHLKQQHPDLLLLIAGKGAQAEALQAQIDERGLNQNVRLLGYVSDDDLPVYYRSANMSIVPSQALEGFGLILLESLSAGTPVLGTPIGGIPEVLNPLSSDLVFGGTEVADIQQGLRDILNGSIALPTQRECQQYAKNHYDWPIVANQLKTVYEAIA